MFFILKNILVFFGGVSTERDISVITGLLTSNCLDKNKYNVVAVYISEKGKFYISEKFNNIENFKNPDLKSATLVTLIPGSCKLYKIEKKLKPLLNVDFAINCIHGKNGEDGTIIGLFRLCNIAFFSPDMFASSCFIDKDLTKIVLKAFDIPYLDYVRIKKYDFFKKSEKYVDFVTNKLNLPVIIKPARLGSSIGIKVAKTKRELFDFISESFSYDDKIICEKYIENARDINVAVCLYDGKIHVSEPEEAFSTDKILSFEDKYGNDSKTIGSNRKFPALLSEEMCKKIKDYAELIFRKCDLSGICRMDFLVKENVCYLNEINTVPGSLAYYLFCKKFADFSILLDKLIEEGENKHRHENNLIKTFNSNVLSGDFKNIKK